MLFAETTASRSPPSPPPLLKLWWSMKSMAENRRRRIMLWRPKGGEIMNKKIIVTAAAIVIVVAGMLSSTKIFAEDAINGQDRIASLVQKIADKFGLNKNDVQAVFDQDRQEHQAQREADYTVRLDQFVKDGKITEAQKQLILAKHKELETKRQSEMQNRQSQTPDQRKAEMDAEREDLQNWATENGIDLKYLMDFGMRGHRGFGMGMRVMPTPANQ